MGVECHGDALVALTMVISTDIKDGMVVTVVPAYQLILFLDKGEESTRLRILTAVLHLSEQPTAGNNSMCFEKLYRRSGFHLTGNDTDQILLHRQFVDGTDLVGLDHNSQRTLEGLPLLALPVEIDTDGDIVDAERRLSRLRCETEFAILRPIPMNASLGIFYHLHSLYRLALGDIGLVERESDAARIDDAHCHCRLLCQYPMLFLGGHTQSDGSADCLHVSVAHRHISQ